MRKVWVVLAGYEDNCPVGVYTNEDRAYEAAKILDGEVAETDLDYIPEHIPGEVPWNVGIDPRDNMVLWVDRATFFPTEAVSRQIGRDHVVECYVWSPARGGGAREEAISRARAKIDKFLAGEQAARIVNSWPDCKRDIGHALQPPLPNQ